MAGDGRPKQMLHGSVEPIPKDDSLPVRSLRVRLRRATFAPDVRTFEDVALGEPREVRVLFDQTTSIEDAERLAVALEKVVNQIRQIVASHVANGGRTNPA